MMERLGRTPARNLKDAFRIHHTVMKWLRRLVKSRTLGGVNRWADESACPIKRPPACKHLLVVVGRAIPPDRAFRRQHIGFLVSAFCAASLAATIPDKASFPFKEEHLNYTITWPSGLPVGEAHLHAHKAPEGWQFDLSLDASVPGFQVVDRYHSMANPQVCSLEFQKDTSHGKRRTQEKTAFDYKKSLARRSTVNGGKSESKIPLCARDALTYLFFARNELAQGRVPPDQTVLAGAAYQVRMEYGGTEPVKIGNKRQEADRVTISLKGPNSDVSFEAFFARDKARTPLLVRCPFSLGIFSLELVR